MARKPKLPSVAPIVIVCVVAVLLAASRCYKTVEAEPVASEQPAAAVDASWRAALKS